MAKVKMTDEQRKEEFAEIVGRLCTRISNASDPIDKALKKLIADGVPNKAAYNKTAMVSSLFVQILQTLVKVD